MSFTLVCVLGGSDARSHHALIVLSWYFLPHLFADHEREFWCSMKITITQHSIYIIHFHIFIQLFVLKGYPNCVINLFLKDVHSGVAVMHSNELAFGDMNGSQDRMSAYLQHLDKEIEFT